jgi:nucleotide-binding universal stress UspA family protein
VIEFKHILCPIDFSDTSMRALTYAAAFTSWYEAQLEVLHVMTAFTDAPASRHPGSIGGSSQPTSRDAIVSEIRCSLESVGATSLRGRRHRPSLQGGSATRQRVEGRS